MANLRGDLLELVPDEARVSDGESQRELHGIDLSYHPPQLPDVVVYPETTAEVAAVLRYANADGVPVVPFGAGTSLEGHVIPLEGGISLDLSRMAKVKEIRPADLVAVVEPGVLRSALNVASGEHGLHFPVDPGADASLGGMAATGASGTTTVRYGGMRPNTIGLEVVLADGSVIRTGGSVRKSSAGYDLTALFLGSEGTLGVITELTLRLHAIPEYVVAARAAFPEIEAACRVAATLVAAGATAERVELLDALTLRAVNAYKGTAHLERPTLFLEFGGGEAAAEGDLELAQALAEAEGCESFEVERDSQARARLWEARHHVAFAVAAASPGKRLKSTDVCVPVSQLPDAVRNARESAEALGIPAAILGHAGDGNFHVVLPIDPEIPEDAERVDALNEAIVADALARGGTCTGEHGIGIGKIRHLEAEHGDLIPLMRGVKRLFDPNGILNPGKVLPAEA
jgi:D-lactate dehydrogenase (cytochrome)